MNAPPAPAQVTASVRSARNADDLWRVYGHLQERARLSRTLPELMFSLANETWQMLPFRQAFVWQSRSGKPLLHTVSGLARLGDDSPLTVWMQALGRWIEIRLRNDPEHDPFFLERADLPAPLQEGWQPGFSEYLLIHPVLAPNTQLLGFVGFALDEAPPDSVQQLLLRLMSAYGYAWSHLAPARPRRRLARRYAGWLLPVVLLGLMLIPVRLSVLAPAEIIGLDALAVSAPMEGVISAFDVQPNQRVVRDQRLFTLDETTLRNRREVASRQLQVARADALAAAQRAFASDASRAELASLNGKVAEREAELTSVQDLLARIEVRSPGDGVVVFGDVNDWQGKPVVTGERVALLADPANPGLLLWMAAADAINLEAGASVRVFLDVAPLQPLPATLFETSYQAVQSPAGVHAYRLRARFDALTAEQEAIVRIGLKGTAKVYGESSRLGYYLFRRPLAALRELTGL